MVVVPSVLRVVNRYWVSGVLRSMKLSSEAKMYLSNVDLSTKKSEILDLCNTAVGKQVALNVRFGKHHTGKHLWSAFSIDLFRSSIGALYSRF